MIKNKKDMKTSFYKENQVFITLRGGFREEMREDASSPPTIFENTFDEYNFAINILNLIDNHQPYALSTLNRNAANKMHHIW